MNNDYYEKLGVDKNASEDDIKRAYRKLAHKYHPDKKEGDEKKFKEINEAYQVLSDKNKRAQYDQFGRADFGGGFSSQGGGPFAGFDFSGFNQGGGGFNFEGNLGDIFEGIFGGGGMNMGGRRTTMRGGSDIKTGLEITLEEVLSGAEKELNYKTLISCEDCQGRGYEKDSEFESCDKCQGKGEVKEMRRSFFGSFVQIRQCPDCFGQGKKAKNSCKKCKGAGRIMGNKSVRIKIRPGVESGQLIRVANAGEDGEKGTKSGDLFIQIIVLPHKVFERQGPNLIIKKEISVVSAILGDEIKIESLDGKELALKIPAGTKHGDILKLRGKGLPRFGWSVSGDLLVEISIRIPKKVSSSTEKTLRDLKNEL